MLLSGIIKLLVCEYCLYNFIEVEFRSLMIFLTLLNTRIQIDSQGSVQCLQFATKGNKFIVYFSKLWGMAYYY